MQLGLAFIALGWTQKHNRITIDAYFGSIGNYLEMKKKQRPSLTLLIIILALVFQCGIPTFAHADRTTGSAVLDEIIRVLQSKNMLSNQYSNHPYGREICNYYNQNSPQFCYRAYGEMGLGEGICRATNGGSTVCYKGYGMMSVGEGICRATNGGSMVCYKGYGEMSVGEGICRAGNGGSMACYKAYGEMSVNEGIELLPQMTRDFAWDWDQFYHSNGKLVWVCRGVQTGQFAKFEQCDGKYKNDNRWPSK